MEMRIKSRSIPHTQRQKEQRQGHIQSIKSKLHLLEKNLIQHITLTLYRSRIRGSNGPVVPSTHPIKNKTKQQLNNWILDQRICCFVAVSPGAMVPSSDIFSCEEEADPYLGKSKFLACASPLSCWSPHMDPVDCAALERFCSIETEGVGACTFSGSEGKFT